MPALQIKDCPENVYERLRVCAAEENRSISQQTLTILEEYLGFRESLLSGNSTEALPDFKRRESLIEKRKRVFAEIDKLRPIPISENLPDGAELLRMVREEDAR